MAPFSKASRRFRLKMNRHPGERRHRQASWAAVVWFCLCLAPPAVAQAPGGSDVPGPIVNGLPNVLDALHQGAALRVSVFTDEKKRLDRQALAKLHCNYPDKTVYQTTRGDSETTFLGLHVCKYDVEVSAVGYLSVDKTVEVTGYVDNIHLEVTLERDPTAVNFDAAGTADALMPEKASKETRRAVRALQEGHLSEAHKHLQSAYKEAPSNSRVNFLLGYEYFQQKRFDQAQTYLSQSAALDPHNAEALVLLGRVETIRGHLDEARAALERAALANPDDVLSHDLLGDTYLKQKQYEKAREQAQLALTRSKGDRNAELVLGQAEANLGNIREGIQALKIFLQAAPQDPVAGQVRDIISQLEQRASGTTTAGASVAVSASVTADPLLDTSKPQLNVAWQPPGIDDAKPSVAPGIPCPTDEVLERAGLHAQELVENIGRFAAIEDLLHERLDDSGNPTSRELRKFEYAASVSESPLGYLMVDEYRTERYAVAELPDGIATSGFPALALVFHPILRGNYEMTCEGLGQWQGQATWLVHFRQREDRPSRIQSFKDEYNTYPVDLKGRAWISADTFQIVRVESELVKPMRQVQYLALHSITEYTAVHFPKKNLDIWLPKSAEVYMDVHRHRYYRRHSFDHYMLFSVDSEQKVREAKHAPHGPGSTTPRKRKYWPA
jgi:tetratricopeptide (TPR) repeat protein